MYIINDYDKLYRPYDKSGNELKRADWVKIPCKHKGDGLQALLAQPRGLEIFAVWILILEKTTSESKADHRGKLLNFKDEPATPREIAKSISLGNRIHLVQTALSALVTMGWIKIIGNAEVTSGGAEVTSPLEKSRVEYSRVEYSNKINAPSACSYSEDFQKFWKDAWKGRWDKEAGVYLKRGKREAFEVWTTLSIEERRAAYIAARKIKKKDTWVCQPDAWRWLKLRRWED